MLVCLVNTLPLYKDCISISHLLHMKSGVHS
ncbi:hypothetical protein NC652_024263 [Populus alba x Populus x berolinensis]|nr:hypothetical protein NC652_024263 [Populus alba x Populus x berolinensis]